MDIRTKYKNYFETWLNLPIERIQQASGIVITSTEKRTCKADGWLIKLPVCAFETDRAVIISCTPEFESNLRCLLCDTGVSSAIAKMQAYFTDEKVLAFEYYRNYGLDELAPDIDIGDVILLNECHYEQFASFFRKIHASLCNHMEQTPEWMPQHFQKAVNKQECFCIIRDNEIVSATESQTIPNKPNGIIDIGINTLSQYRQKGYAASACAAFIRHYQEKEILSLWSYAFNNEVSEKLALKLGFTYMGNVFYVTSF